MRDRFLHAVTILLVAASTSLQGPMDVLQLFAWTSMMVDYSQELGLSEGIKQTFSGEAPCSLCLSILDSRTSPHSEEGLEAPPPPPQPVVFLETIPRFYSATPPVIATFVCTQHVRTLDLPPPEAPPPRQV